MNDRPIRSDLGWATADRVVVRGYDLPSELLGRIDLGQMAFLELMGRLPSSSEAVMINAMLVCLVEHGLTPSALATRLTELGAPGSLQSAVAAGLLGLGDRFVGSIEGAARLVQGARLSADEEVSTEELASSVVEEHLAEGRIIPGLGHPLHRPLDPRSTQLFTLAEAHGFAGPHVALIRAISTAASERTGRELPVNATGAIGAIAVELGLPWEACRGLGVMARAVGLVGHVLEERRRPIARELWRRAETEATEAQLAQDEDTCTSSRAGGRQES